MPLHSELTGSDLHEPKGVATASAGTVYVADGSGSGDWTPLLKDQVALVKMVPSLGTAGTYYVVSPVAGTITAIYGVLENSFSTSNATVTGNINGTGITGGAFSINYSGSAAGQVFTLTPTGNNTLNAGDAISFVNASGPSGTCPLTITVLINANS